MRYLMALGLMLVAAEDGWHVATSLLSGDLWIAVQYAMWAQTAWYGSRILFSGG